MGFLKTLFTGKRDELTEEEMKQYEELHKNDGEDYQLVDDSSQINAPKFDLEEVLKYISTLNSSQLVKVKNKIAQVEDDIQRGVVNTNSSIESKESFDEEEDFQYNSKEFEESENFKSSNDDNSAYSNLDDDDFEVVDESSIYGLEENKNEDAKNNDSDDKVNSKENLIVTHDNEDDDEFVEINDVNVSKLKSNDNLNDGEDDSSYDDPALFSVIHDELMELFEDGQVILLKEEFTFPSLGSRDTLAFGIFNNSLSQISEQTHWFIQHLKQFSRLKECKMLLSEENEKDLILDVNDKYAILICFKTSNLVKEEFVFNRKWD
ncbi:MAG: hypothetical protein LAT82_03790 [Nanoarchaeota archaeon]|nr:hypothetical protein [Nanoarchaeota archaeon]